MRKPTRNSVPPLEFEPKTSAGKFTDRYVAETEEMLELSFTPSFLAFLKANNGGVPKTRYFKLGRNEKVIDFFLSLVPKYETHPMGEQDIGVVWSQIEDRLNSYLVPFAAVYPGDFLCFDYKRGTNPRVVLWDHERSDEDDPHTTPVADSFAEFLGLLSGKEPSPARRAKKVSPKAGSRRKTAAKPKKRSAGSARPK